MQKTTGIGLIALVLAIAGVAVVIALTGQHAVPVRSGSVDFSNISAGTTPAKTTVPAAGAMVLDYNPGRKHFALYHDDLTTTAYCTLNSTSTAISTNGITLASTTKNYWSSGEEQIQWEGQVWCKASATTTIRTIEAVQ